MDKAKKKRIKKYISWISMALVVALLSAMPLLARQEAEADGPVASILSAEVTRGTISASLHGGGTLSAETVEEVKLPSGVKITEFLVKNGQFVTEGTPVAALDKVSVMTAITEVSETMEYLREELEDARDEKVSSSIKATAGGRVKKIFAQKGEAVQEVMLRDGALAILSLDGLMAVKLEENLELTTGESVTVLLGEEKLTGRVESNLDGVVIITVEDEGYDIGAAVTVMKNGVTLGEGELYIHNAWKATAYTGTIETVNAKEEKTLSSGATLFTLTDRDYEGELRYRASQHREYEELLQELFRMYESGVLTAPCDGEVEGVDEDSAYLLSAVPEGWVLAPLNSVTSTEEKGYQVLLLSGEVIDSPTGNPSQQSNEESQTPSCQKSAACTLPGNAHQSNELDCPALCKDSDCHINLNVTSEHAAVCITHCIRTANFGDCKAAKHYDECIHSCTAGTRKTPCEGKKYHQKNCINSCDQADGIKTFCDATGEHELTCILACVDADKEGVCPAKPNHSVNCIERCNGTMDCPSNKHNAKCPHYQLTYTAQVGLVEQCVSGTIIYNYSYEATDITVIKDDSGNFTIPLEINKYNMIYKDSVNSDTPCKKGDTILIVTGISPNGTVVINRKVYVYQSANMDLSSLAGMMGGMGGFDLSKMIGGFSGFGNYGAAAPEEEPLFDLEGDPLLTVTPHDSAKLFISIDEHDIAKVSLGMAATVKVEALKGQEFPAEVTNIALSGSNNGGSSKFAVELTLPMSEEMLSGMSASAVLPLEEKNDILLIPAAALTQQGAKTVVFTALDEKTGEPASPVEVQTGLTDGEHVEILSGLSEGQKVYYSYYDTVELDTSAYAEKYTLR